MKTLDQILLDALKDKHVTVYLYGNTNPSASGFVHNIKSANDWYGGVVQMTLNTGRRFEELEFEPEHAKFDIC